VGEHAPQGAAPCSAPQINGPVVQREFTFLLRETCSPSPSATVGAVARNGCRAGAGVSRGRSTESNEPANPDGLTTREGLNLAGRTRPSVVLTRSDEADRLSIRAAITVAEKEWLLRPQGLPGTAVRGPACTVVWEAGGATLPPTRLGKGCCTAHRAVDDDCVVDGVGPNLNDGVAGRSIQVLWSSMLGGRCMDPELVTTPRLFGRVEQPAMNSNVSVAAMKAICFLFLIWM